MISNKERIGDALELLAEGLYPQFKEQMRKTFLDQWQEEAQKSVKEYKNMKKRELEERLYQDIGALLQVISRKWGKAFEDHENLDNQHKGIVLELIQLRNNWAHGNEFSDRDTERAIDNMVLLLMAFQGEKSIINQLKQHQEIMLSKIIEDQNMDPDREKKLRRELSKLLKKIPFQNVDLLNHALTHSSYLYEHPKEVKRDNELLEFLGDSVLNFISGEYLYHKYKSVGNEGDLTKLRSALVENKQLAKFAEKLALQQYIRLGKGVALNPSLLSNTFEAMIGACFLDSGMKKVQEFIQPLFDSVIAEIASLSQGSSGKVAADSKNRLQEWVQKNIGPITPEYETIKEEGADHQKQFTVQVMVEGKVYGQGKGLSKKEASKKAAEKALAKIYKLGL
ncbi:ribonuclease III [Limnospira platensis]|uniref:ribonuclease III n=1 Tax=Limnospira platensis TaxID=118562 RepID=UPI003D6E1441